MAAAAVVETPSLPAPLERLRPGHVVFCARPSLLQRWGELAGGEWRHAGVMVETPEGLMMSGFGRKSGYSLLPVAEMTRYSRIGVGEVFTSDAEVRQLHRWLRQFESCDAWYTTSAVILGGLFSATRRAESRLIRGIARAVIRGYCAVQAVRYRERPSFVCSTFVLAAINAAAVTSCAIPITRSHDAAAEDATPASVADLLIARWVASPTDIWRAIEPGRRWQFELEATETETSCSN